MKSNLNEQIREMMQLLRSGDPDKVRSGLLGIRAGLMRLINMIDDYLADADRHDPDEYLKREV